MLREKTEKMVKEVNELKELCFNQLRVSDMLEDMDGPTFEMLTRAYKLLDCSLDLMTEQAEQIDNMNIKLDKIIKKLDA